MASGPPHPPLIVALAGNPNSGKTTLFNALTGLRQKVANYPGVTVERKTGSATIRGHRLTVVDLPGTYSLVARSPDEYIAMEVLRGLRQDTPQPDAVVLVVDASNLQRNLYLASQVLELGLPTVVALTMLDIARSREIAVDVAALERELGCRVVPVNGKTREGLDDLGAALLSAGVPRLPRFEVPAAMDAELALVATRLAEIDRGSGESDAGELGTAAVPRAWICIGDDSRRLERYLAMAERLLIGDRGGDAGRAAKMPAVEQVLRTADERLRAIGIDAMQADIEAHYRWIENVTGKVESSHARAARAPAEPARPRESNAAAPTPRRRTWTDRADAILMHRVWGLLIFAGLMCGLFYSIFSLADPVMGWIEAATGHLATLCTGFMSEGPLKSLIHDGVFAGVGAVVVFIPQITLLFLFLAIMEDSGYLARAAFLMDRLLSRSGLHGKSFIPLLSSFACAIPGIMSTRTIESREDRLATIFVAPFMACSARIPVYVLLVATFFASMSAWGKAGIMLALYGGGIAAAFGTAMLMRRTLLKSRSSTFILELPPYRRPQVTQVLRVVWTNVRSFLVKAGTIIFCLSVVLWALLNYPWTSDARRVEIRAAVVAAHPDLTEAEQIDPLVDRQVSSEQTRHSIAGRIGHFIEPAIAPLGFDWKMGVGLVGAFAAREVFNSTMAIVYATDDGEDNEGLRAAMAADVRADGKPVWRPLVAVSMMVWFVLAMQCMSTLAIVRRETQSWRWPIGMLLYMNGLAYVVCLVVYQTGRALGW